MLEADRYGPDPWIFVRELLQNSRDAGATAVDFTIGSDATTEWVACYDDGEGMTFEHARQYLFALYASSKEDNSRQAGKFGVGFWSVLRFSPISITIRSRPRNGTAWGLRLDGSLEQGDHIAPPERFGTEIVLVRALGDGRLQHRIFDTVRQSARYLRLRDQPDRPLPIRISGRLANEEFALPAPSASFQRKHVRGVVGLGSAPRVELFSRGLRLRAAACLEDLVAPTGRHSSRMRVQFPELPGGLAPTALLESDSLEVMLSRSDARDNRALSKLVRLAQKELERLIDQQVAHARPQPWWRRGYNRAALALRNSLAARTLVGAGMGGVVAVGTSVWLWGSTPTDPPEPPAAPAVGAALVSPTTQQATPPYGDLGERYRGPRVDVLAPDSAEPVDLRYTPASFRLHFAALTFPRLSSDGSPIHEAIATASAQYVTAPAQGAVTRVTLAVRGSGRPIRIPVPTGHRVVADSVHFDGEPLRVFASGEGHPVVTVGEGLQSDLTFETVAAVDPAPVAIARLPTLPDTLRQQTETLKAAPIAKRVGALLATVRSDVRYDRTAAVAEQHTQAVDSGEGFIDRTLAIGAGDCDVQNGLLVALLQSADVHARLAVGYVGVGGSVPPWLHAWAEYLGEDGAWHVVDASERVSATAGGPPRDPAAVVAVAQPVFEPDATPSGPTPTPTVAVRAPRDPASASGDGVGAAPEDPLGDPLGDPMGDPLDAEGPPAPQTPPAAPAPAAPAAPESLRAQLTAWEAERPWALPGGAAFLLLVAIGGLTRGRTLRDINLDDSTDLSRLLQGVLQQPAAFSHMASLFHRPLVPMIDGRLISLQRTRELATKGRLYRTATRPGLAARAAKAGSVVLDAATPEGRTVADAVGAVDLDAWAVRFDHAWTDGLCDAVNATLRAHKEPWRVRLGSQIPGRLASLDLTPLGVRIPGDSAGRLVLVEGSSPWWDEIHAKLATTPHTATFRILDQLAERLDLPEERRALLLANAAKAALLESHGAAAQPPAR